MIRRKPGRSQAGFTLVELIVVLLVAAVLIGVLILPNFTAMRERARRINCLGNMSQVWKALSAWDLDSGGVAPGAGMLEALKAVPPEIFICPEAGRLCKVQPDTNCYYEYFAGWRDSDGANVLLCDMDGPNRIAGPHAWGGNHGGRGGHVLKAGGSGCWVGVDASRSYGLPCITNAEVAGAIPTNIDKAVVVNGLMVLSLGD